MASDYHPLYATLWNDDKLEGASFEGKGFFAYLCTNERVRPSGIYRMTDMQFVADTGLPLPRVRGYLGDLEIRGLIVRDGAWLFVVGYFKRQPKGPWLVKGVLADIDVCSSVRILQSFSQKYPIHDQRVVQRLEQLSHQPSLARGLNAVTTQRNATQLQRKCKEPSDAASPLVCAHPSDGFTEFWEAYPAFRHLNKADALKAWCSLNPDPTLRQTILAALEAQKQRPDWQPHHQGGKYIPHPHRWLAKHRWEDAPPAAQATLLTEKTAGNIDAAQRFLASATKPREAR